MTEFPVPDYPLEKRFSILTHIEKNGPSYSRKELTKNIKENFGPQGHKFVQYIWKTGHLRYGPLGGIIFTRRGWHFRDTLSRTVEETKKRSK